MRLIPPESRMHIEFNYDALLRSSPKERGEHEAKMVQNGIMTRNEVRHLENLPPVEGGDQLTVQTNLIQIDKLGQQAVSNTQGSSDGTTIQQ